jgi:hypothetical protein
MNCTRRIALAGMTYSAHEIVNEHALEQPAPLAGSNDNNRYAYAFPSVVCTPGGDTGD